MMQMTPKQASPDRGSSREYYFFLSYAHTAPNLEQKESADLWVTTFYQDLCTQVRKRADRSSNLDIGFMEKEQLPISPEWTAGVAAALGTSEVFVPLYSPLYLDRSWPLSELASFQARLREHDADHVAAHIQPVRWVPLAGGEPPDGLGHAPELGADIPEYANNGLLAMCRLTIFREQYTAILHELAERIVHVTEQQPLGRSTHPAPIQATRPANAGPQFVIGAIAPTSTELTADRAPGTHGGTAAAWRPFGTPQVLPVTEYVANVAQRLGLGTETTDLLTDSEALQGNPGVAVIDPWILAVTNGASRLHAAVKALPDWVVLLLLADEADPNYGQRGDALVTEARSILAEHPEHVVKYARDASGFIQTVPSVVTQARRRFLNRAPMPTTGRHAGRRRPKHLISDEE